MGGGEAFSAEKDPPPIKDTYVVDNLTYYDVGSSNINVPQKLYEDIFTKEHSSLGNGMSLGKLWLLMATRMPNRSFGFNFDTYI